jgi:hypothetical protein
MYNPLETCGSLLEEKDQFKSPVSRRSLLWVQTLFPIESSFLTSSQLSPFEEDQTSPTTSVTASSGEEEEEDSFPSSIEDEEGESFASMLRVPESNKRSSSLSLGGGRCTSEQKSVNLTWVVIIMAFVALLEGFTRGLIVTR